MVKKNEIITNDTLIQPPSIIENLYQASDKGTLKIADTAIW